MNEIIPFNNYALNLNDLENIEGWNEKANKDDIFCFKLNEQGKYERYLLKGQEPADIDFQLLPDKIIRDEEGRPTEILNSGKMLVSLKPPPFIVRKFNKYYLSHFRYGNKTGPYIYSIKSIIYSDTIELTKEFPEFKMIIEGYSIKKSLSEIVNGIKVQLEKEQSFEVIISSTDEVLPYKPFEYKTVIKVKCNEQEYLIPIEIVNLNEIVVTEKYLINRIQFFVL